MLNSEPVLVVVAPTAEANLYQFFDTQFRGGRWEPHVTSITDLAKISPKQMAAVVAYATDWPDEHLAEWLTLLRKTIGPRKRLLAILPHPPAQYPPAIRALWTQALGYGFRVNEAIAIVDDFVAGRA